MGACYGEDLRRVADKVATLEAETARIKKLQADDIDTKLVRFDVVKSGEMEVFVAMGSFQPIFIPLENSQYIVNATADDGSTSGIGRTE
jgi:hypothetical protein